MGGESGSRGEGQVLQAREAPVSSIPGDVSQRGRRRARAGVASLQSLGESKAFPLADELAMKDLLPHLKAVARSADSEEEISQSHSATSTFLQKVFCDPLHL